MAEALVFQRLDKGIALVALNVHGEHIGGVLRQAGLPVRQQVIAQHGDHHHHLQGQGEGQNLTGGLATVAAQVLPGKAPVQW